jgi:diketogulonate reductase-like aldo/keto reductase
VTPSRRDVLKVASFAVVGVVGCGRERRAPAAGAGPGAPPVSMQESPENVAAGDDAREELPMITRRVPSTGEELPAIGLGSWQTFDVGDDDVAGVQPVLARFLELGGRVVDSSPMYGRAEGAIGKMLAGIAATAAAGGAARPFLATKVWTSGEAKGQAQMRRSMELMGVATGEGKRPLDLMQIHNLLDWKTHLKTLRAWKDAGTFRYIGVTHYQESAFGELEQIVKKEKLDFVQLPYSVSDRAAEARLLPAAADAGAAVLVMQPFDTGGLFDRVRGKALPPVAAELGASSWAQLFLLWILGHEAVTCPIPATSKLKHLEDNLAALRMKVPDAVQRAAVLKAVES